MPYLSRAPQEGNMWGSYYYRNTTLGCCWCCGLCKNTTWSSFSEHCLGPASERGVEEEILQELVQVQEEGFYQVFQEVWNWWWEKGHSVTAGENEEVLHCYSCFGPYPGILICIFLSNVMLYLNKNSLTEAHFMNLTCNKFSFFPPFLCIYSFHCLQYLLSMHASLFLMFALFQFCR